MNIVDKTGCTVLHFTVLLGNINVVYMLLNAKVSPRIEDVDGKTSLDFAFAFESLAAPFTFSFSFNLVYCHYSSTARLTL